jgi:UPF0271 protein
MNSPRIDLNADVGEIPAALVDGSEARLVRVVTSVNVACGGHAGNAASMAALVSIAHRLGVAIGAHPSYPDPANFGRETMRISASDLQASITAQVETLIDVAHAQGARVRHVKPHGALYNAAATDANIAATIARALEEWRSDLILVGLAGAKGLAIWREAGFRVAGEAFADRRYEPDGSLRSRRHADALVADPKAAAQQALDIAAGRGAVAVDGQRVALAPETLCVHGDTPNACAIAQAVRSTLEVHGIELQRLSAICG